VKRISGWLLPLALAVVGAVLIIVGELDLDDEPAPSLAPIPTPTEVALATPTPPPSVEATASIAPTPVPTPTPLPDDVVAVQLEIPAVGINVRVEQSTSAGNDDFPDDCCAFILRASSQPGRGTNSYIFAHAITSLFKPLWNAQIGDEVRVLMSNDLVFAYRITEVHPNVSCPDSRFPPHPTPPLDLVYALPNCDEGAIWTAPTDEERLTLQTSQGFNRNWGELVVVAEPVN
jgi:hypothetical protein